MRVAYLCSSGIISILYEVLFGHVVKVTGLPRYNWDFLGKGSGLGPYRDSGSGSGTRPRGDFMDAKVQKFSNTNQKPEKMRNR